MIRFPPILGMISLLVLGGCTAARNIGSISLDEWNSLGDCSARSEFADVMGSPDSVIRLEEDGSIELHEFIIKPPEANSKALSTAASVLSFGLLDLTNTVANKEASPNYKTCTGHDEANLECASAKGVVFTHYAGNGRDEIPFCEGLKVIQMGSFDGFNEFTTCPPLYRKLLAGEIDTNGFPGGYGGPKPAPLIGTTTLLYWQRGLKKIHDEKCE